MTRTIMCLSVAAAVGIAMQANAQTSTAPKVTVGKQLTAKAKAPTAPATAKQKSTQTSIGKGGTSVNAAQPSSFWTEEVDVDDDGTVETSDFLYDAQRGVLYSYREDDFACANGQPASGSILEALYAKGNKAKRPVGSGWYAVGVDAGKCAMKEAGLYGCRFDATGNPTKCGVATLNTATGELDVAMAQ